MKRTLLALLIWTTGAVIGTSAHHSFAAFYLEDQTISIEGEIVEFEYRSPHSFVHLMAPDESGTFQRFSAEWANPNRLSQRGVKSDTLKPGDRVIISGSPGRNPAERRLHLKRIHRPADGWSWPGQS
jgi:Family of unknown function (DUF6152)